ncbi:alpha/beta fold hydrolase [Roseovarius ramblicola]|uniref:Alpha/beta fold hydrolase n=1 Tax=Roseovarius ramblicola TaxID=2022336 RepID=A0ABV5I0W4_9RHOB
MPIIHVNAGDGLPPALALDDGDSGPVIVMVHGFKYAPGHATECPHKHIFALAPARDCFKVVSWPRGLGFGGRAPDEGLAIGFGWNARGSLWRAYAEAARAGAALAALVTAIRARAPHRPVHAIAHSFGARVVLAALAHLAPGALGRIILLAGAEFGHHARAALATPAGRATEIVNVTTRENDLFDALLEWLIPAPARGDRSLGLALGSGPNVLTLQLDDGDTLGALARAGFDIAPPAARICHWSPYTRAGALPFYARLLREPDRLSLARLRAALPDRAAPRWSRIAPDLRLPLPIGRRASF